MKYEQLYNVISSGKFSPLYYLYGDEPYFIDKLTKLIEKQALQPHEEAFNKNVFYGNEADAGKVLGAVRSFPMMAERRLVVLREAQRMKKNEFEKLLPYFTQPVNSTVFVIVHKGKKLDGRSKLAKVLGEKAVNFESKPLYEDKVPDFISSLAKEKKFSVTPDALRILSAYLGNNLGLIENEIDKILLYLSGSGKTEIDAQVVYQMINVDKDFNVFELMNAIGRRDHAGAHLIISQMMKNVKENPPVLIVFQLFNYFSKLNILIAENARSADQIAKVLRMNAYIARDYLVPLKKFHPRELQRNLVNILEADLFLKGIRQTHMSDEHVLKTLVYKLLN